MRAEQSRRRWCERTIRRQIASRLRRGERRTTNRSPGFLELLRWSLDIRQLAADLLVGRAFLVIHFNESPAHDSLGVDDERRGVRPAVAIGIEDAVAVDDFVIFVFEEREIELAVEAFAQHRAKSFRIGVVIDAHGEDLNFFFLRFGQ